MYNPPIIKDGAKIYKLRSAFKRHAVFVLCFVLILSAFAMFAVTLGTKTFVEPIIVLILAFFGIAFCLESIYLNYSFQLKLTAQEGILSALGKTVRFKWENAQSIGYVFSDKQKTAQLVLYLAQSNISTTGYRFAFANYSMLQFIDQLIPLDNLYHQKSFWSLNPNRSLPTSDECSIHLRHFLQTPMGQDIIRYAPHVLDDVLHKYLPDNDLQRD